MTNSERMTEQNDSHNARVWSVSMWLQDHVYVATLIVLIASLVPRLFLTLSADPEQLKFPDSGTYFRPAINLLEKGKFLNKMEEPEVSRTPGYPIFLVAVMAVTGKNLENNEDLRTILVVQTIITSWSVVFLYWLARWILPPVIAFTGALLAAFSPWGAVRAGFALTEGLHLLILALLFWSMYLVVEGRTKPATVLVGGGVIGLLTSVAVFVRPIWPLVPIIAISLVLLCGDKRQKAWILVVAMLVCSVSPLYLWKARNLREAQFDGLSMIAGSNAYGYLASSVKAQLKGAEGNRWKMAEIARDEQMQWSQSMSLQEKNDERWRRANAIFREYPFLTVYSFALNAGEAIIHPDPGILKPAGLNFYSDTWVLAGFWVALLILAGVGLCCIPDRDRDGGLIQRKWLVAILVICMLLTLSSGVSYGGGSRFRAPLELIVPLLAAIGLMRVVHKWRGN